MGFPEQLISQIQRKKSILICGIDPVYENLPAFAKESDPLDSLKTYFVKVIKTLKDRIAGVKLQSAHFELYRDKGIKLLFELAEQAKKEGLITIFDGKRGDIDSTSKYYAQAYLGSNEFDSMTVNPYLGGDSISPFIDQAEKKSKGIFVLTRTTNHGSDDLQTKNINGVPVYMHVARLCSKIGSSKKDKSGYSPVGLVAPSTFPESLKEIRNEYKNCFILIPGIGAQKGETSTIKYAHNKDGFGALVNISRSLCYPANTTTQNEWEIKITEIAENYNKQLAAKKY